MLRIQSRVIIDFFLTDAPDRLVSVGLWQAYSSTLVFPINTAVNPIWARKIYVLLYPQLLNTCLKRRKPLYNIDTFLKDAIRQRCKNYPDDWSDQQHHARLLVPPSVAFILRSSPQTVSAAVRAFYFRDDLDVRAIRTMKHFPAVEKFVRVRVRFSRCLFAMLSKQRFDFNSLRFAFPLSPMFAWNNLLARRNLYVFFIISYFLKALWPCFLN